MRYRFSANWLALIVPMMWLTSFVGGAEQPISGPAPHWVADLGAPSPTAIVSHVSGVAYDLIDRQINVGADEDYNRIVVHVLSDTGRSHLGELRFDFAPSYQTLVFHQIRILRHGQAIDRLDLSKLKLLRREQNAEAGMYNGWVTAVMILDDLRVGDVVEYAWTERGSNPVFGGVYSGTLMAKTYSPVERLYSRVLFPSERKLRRRTIGPPVPDPTEARQGELTEWIWDTHQLPGQDFEFGAPSWFVQYSMVQLSEYPDWNAVADWGIHLYPLDAPLPPDLETMIASLRGKRSEEAVLACLHYVQKEIRYLSLSLGESSHRPHLPSEVIAQRFGDCKDKALLLSVMLRRLGFDAVPALVNTSRGRTLVDCLPSPQMFDHAIVLLHLDVRDIWLDPTRAYQAGTLEDHSVNNLWWGLPLRPNQTSLASFSSAVGRRRRLSVVETYRSTANTAPVRLTVRRAYEGPSAESMRAYLADNTPERVGKDALNTYLRIFPSIREIEPVVWKDDRDGNRITIVAQYEIAEFWKQRKSNSSASYTCELVPVLLNQMLDPPDRPERVTPLDYGEPVTIDSTVQLDLHEKLTITPVKWSESTPAFTFSKSSEYHHPRFEIRYVYTTTGDPVLPKAMRAFVEKIEAIRSRIGYTLTAGGAASVFVFNWAGAYMTILVAAGALYGAWRIWRWKSTLPRHWETRNSKA